MFKIDPDIIKKFEFRRKSIVKKVYLTAVAVFAIAVIIFLSMGSPTEIIPHFLMFTVLGVVGISSIFTARYRRNFKTSILQPIIKDLYPNLDYYPNSGISSSEVSYTRIESLHERFNSEDLLTGTIKGVNVKVSDVHIQKRETYYDGKHTRTRYVTTFRGRWVILDFNKSFSGLIQVIESMKFGRKLNSFFSSSLKMVEMESINFNKKFATYTTDEHNAFYVITPQIQEKLLEIEGMHAGNIKYGFKDGEVHIGINDGSNSLESNVFRPITDQYISHLLSSVKFIEKYIDILRLNEKIFK